ncbi:MAG: FecR family protein [Cyclobacteriaceae bacterium]
MDFEIIWKKINGSLSQEEELAFNTWLNESDEHKKLFENAKRYYREGSNFENWPANTMQAWQKVEQSMGTKQGVGSNRRWITWTTSAAAAIALIAVAGNYFRETPKPQPETAHTQPATLISPGTDKAILILDDSSTYELSAGQNLSLNAGGSKINSQGTSLEYTQGEETPREVRYNTLKIPRGGEFALTLADGTKVWLNSESSLRFPVSFVGETRDVELQGEAYFDVAESQIPFRVISSQQVVQVLGTEFNISSYKEDSLTVTTLVEGKVDVFMSENPGIRQSLHPNQQSSLVRKDGRIVKRDVDPHEFIAWREGRFAFRAQSLSSIMKTLSRWYDIDVTFENKEAQNILFTGDIKRHENFENILELIEKTHEVKFTIEGRSIMIK